MSKRSRRRKRGNRRNRPAVRADGAAPAPAYGGQVSRRLWNCIEKSRKLLEPFRTKRREAITQYVGAHYSDQGTKQKIPINLLELGISIYLRHIAAKNPQALCTPKAGFQSLKPHAYTLELAINHLIEEIDLLSNLQAWALDGLFGLAIMKVGLTIHEDDVEGFLHDAGQPFADVVDLDDWVHDTEARRYEEAKFAGNRYRLPYAYVMESNLYDKKAREWLQPSSGGGVNAEGDQKVETITHPQGPGYDTYEDFVDLYDIWLPQENVIVTLPAEGEGLPLREADWDGPERGPYHLLRFKRVPRSIMPLAHVAVLRDLHDLVNVIYRKLGRQAQDQKTILGYAGPAAPDAQRVVEASDSEMVRMDAPGKVAAHRLGGIDQQNLAFGIHTIDRFKELAGNLDALGGLGPQSETLGQDRLLSQSASKLIADMQDRMTTVTKGVVRDLGWYLWTDPLIELPLVKRIPGTSLTIPVTFTADQREGDYFDYAIDIVPYSMTDRSPAEKLQTLSQLFAQFIFPFAPQMQQQGVSVDFMGLLRLVSRYADMPELNDVLTMAGEIMPDQTGGQTPRQSPTTTRTNVRVNRPGGTMQGKDNALVQTLSGGRVQPSEGAGILSSTG